MHTPQTNMLFTPYTYMLVTPYTCMLVDASDISTIPSSSHEPEIYTASTILDQNLQTTTGYFSQTSDISTSHASGSSTGESFSTETQTSNPNSYSSTASIAAFSTATNKETIGT